MKTAMVVVPPPRSTQAQPSSDSSSTSADSPLAIGRGDQPLERQVAAVDRKLEVARGLGIDADHVHVDAEPLPDHAERIGDAAVGIERIADRQRMDDRAAFADRMPVARREHAADVGLFHRLAGDGDACRIGLAGEPPGGEVDDEGIDRDAGAAFGGVDRKPDRLLGGVEIDDHARLDAARTLVAEAEHLDRMGAATHRLGRFAHRSA